MYRQTTLRRRRDYWRRMLTERDPAAEMRLFGLGQHFVALWRRLTDRILKEIEAGFRRIAIPLELMPELATVVLNGFALLALILLAMRGEISVGALVALIYITEEYLNLVGNMMPRIGWVWNPFLTCRSRICLWRKYHSNLTATWPIRPAVGMH